MKPLNIADIRKKHANAIKNTATGRALGKALDEIAELRGLLETATDAWEDGAQLWHDGKLYVDYRQAALPKDWYEAARKLIAGKDGEA